MKKNFIFIAHLAIVFIVGLVIGPMGYDLFTWQYWVLSFAVFLSYCLGRLYKCNKKPDTVKVQILGHTDSYKLNDMISKFIFDKNIVDIKYQSVLIPYEHDNNGNINKLRIADRVLIIYTEED